MNKQTLKRTQNYRKLARMYFRFHTKTQLEVQLTSELNNPNAIAHCMFTIIASSETRKLEPCDLRIGFCAQINPTLTNPFCYLDV